MNNTVHIKNMVLGVLAVAGSAVAQVLGGWDRELKILVALMAMDYGTGWLVAAVWHRSSKSASGALSSDAGFKGLIKKSMILALVLMAHLLDLATGSHFVRTAVCLFFIANEALSVLENTSVMGVPYPNFVKSMLEAMGEQADQGGGQEGGSDA